MIFILKFFSRLFAFFSQKFGLGTGVTWSGEIALRLDPQILPKLIPQGSKVVLIAGTNGKTTTTKMIKTIIGTSLAVIHNSTGANLVNGLVGTILTSEWQLKGKKVFLFEVDESNLPGVLQEVEPDVLVLLNLFRDQLDRYGEVDAIVEKWMKALSGENLSGTTLIVNGDDPSLAFLGSKVAGKLRAVKYFGINDKSLFSGEIEHAVDAIFCPNCGKKLKFSGAYLSHLGDYHCPKCLFDHPKLNLETSKVDAPIEGLYMLYNVMAAVLVGQELGINSEQITSGLKDFKPAFGRQEKIIKNGRTIKILLSKNPAGFNASLRTFLEGAEKGPVLLVLNDRIPDGQDVSWIWDVDFENLTQKNVPIFASGDRAYDLALRLKYAGVNSVQINGNLNEAVNYALEETGDDEILWILPTYSAMLEVRKILTGKSIL